MSEAWSTSVSEINKQYKYILIDLNIGNSFTQEVIVTTVLGKLGHNAMIRNLSAAISLAIAVNGTYGDVFPLDEDDPNYLIGMDINKLIFTSSIAATAELFVSG